MGIRPPRRQLRTIALLLIGFTACLAPGATAKEIALKAADWTFTADTGEVTTYKGVPALSLYNAVAWMDKIRFRNGTIAFKVSFPKDRGFVGLRFRVQDHENYEHFYLRPHLSGKPDANQYTPVFHKNTGWQIYYGPRYSAPVTYPYGAWIELKLVISGNSADVYIDSDTPVLHIANLKRGDKAGSIGFDSYFTHAFISDLRITNEKAPKLVGKAAPLTKLPDHLVRTWQVSEPIPPFTWDTENKALATDKVSWRALPVESNGIANLGRIGPARKGRNMILARLTVLAQKSMLKPLHFGFSDKVTAFVNGKPVYQGNDTFQTRDYRYLGTVGRFDTLILPLKEGQNDIVFAVEENFGGWALTAAFDDMKGIRIASGR